MSMQQYIFVPIYRQIFVPIYRQIFVPYFWGKEEANSSFSGQKRGAGTFFTDPKFQLP